MTSSFIPVLLTLVMAAGVLLTASVQSFAAHRARLTQVAPVLALVAASDEALMQMMASGGAPTPQYQLQRR